MLRLIEYTALALLGFGAGVVYKIEMDGREAYRKACN